jgi:hypothetical protein
MRLTIFLLLFSLSAQGQFIIDSYRFGAPAAPLLDSFPGAAAAYSLRLLRTAYTGDAIVVRRSSNNDTLTIGFSGNYLDTVALKNFCGTGATDTCFVRRWFDQSSVGNNIAATTNSNQPRIMINGEIVYANGKPALRFVASKLDASIPLYDTTFATFLTYQNIGTATGSLVGQWALGQARRLIFSINQNCAGATATNSLNLFIQGQTDGSCGLANSLTEHKSQTVSATALNLTSATHATGSENYKSYHNGTLNDSSTSLGVLRTVNTSFGAANSTLEASLNAFYSEIIIYNSNQSANRTAIETNINNFYLIY